MQSFMFHSLNSIFRYRSFTASGDCTFNGNKKGNIAIVNHVVSLQHSEFLEDNYEESGFTNTDVSMPNGNILNGRNILSSPISIDDTEESSPSASHNESLHQNTTADISIISID